MKIELKYGLPFVSSILHLPTGSVGMEYVLVDTGSASSVFSADKLFAAGLRHEPEDTLKRVFGVGGSEFVFSKKIQRIDVGDLVAFDLTITVGAMDYGIEIDGILGMDFLRQIGAVVNLQTLTLEYHQK